MRVHVGYEREVWGWVGVDRVGRGILLDLVSVDVLGTKRGDLRSLFQMATR